MPIKTVNASGDGQSEEAPAQAALSVSGLSYSYNGKEALKNVSFAIERGRFTALLGPNGAGKSTLFSLITRLFVSVSGDIVIEGMSLRQAGNRALVPLGVVFQQPALDLDLSVRQNLRYFSALQGLSRSNADKRIHDALDTLDMAERGDEKVRTLNGGHRRRVEIARAVLHRPRLLLLDEPTVGLDVPTRAAIVKNIHRMAREKDLAVLWATHLIDEIEPNDQLIVLHQGVIVEQGATAAVIERSGTSDLGAAFAKLIGNDGDKT